MENQAAINHIDIILANCPESSWVELRAFSDDTARPSYGGSFWLPASASESDIQSAVKWSQDASNRGNGVFIGYNPRDKQGDGSKANVHSMTSYYVDLDVNKVGISKEEALSRLEEKFNSGLEPSLVVDSGNGFHLIYFSDGIVTDKGNWRDVQEGLYDEFKHLGADRAVVSDESRVLRLTPFENQKGNERKQTKILSFNPSSSKSNLAGRFAGRSSLVARSSPAKSQVPSEIVAGGTEEYGGRNDLLFREGCSLRDRGYDENEIRSMLASVNESRCTPPLFESELDAIAASVMRYRPSSELVVITDDMFNDLSEKFGQFRTHQYPNLETVVHGLYAGEVGMIQAKPNVGKDQPLDSLVKTIDGWVRMGDIAVGDEIASVDGNRSTVYGVYPQGERPVYRLTFSDGRTAEAGEDHLWRVYTKSYQTEFIVTTLELKEIVESRKYRIPVSIPTSNGYFGSARNLPIPAWVLGVLIGDGGLTNGSPMFSTADESIVDRMKSELSVMGVGVKHSSKYDYRISSESGGRGQNGVTNALRDLGLFGMGSADKFIPKQYLLSDRTSRLELLRGLIDTDGYVSGTRGMFYTTVSYQLALDVQELARSLGALAVISDKLPTYRGVNGRREIGQRAYTVTIRHTDSKNFVWLERKRKRMEGKSPHRTPRLNVKSVEYIGMKETQCIAVTHPSKLYITDNYVVTHNTTLMLNVAMSAATGEPFFPIIEKGRPKKVVYLDCENRAVFFQKDLVRMASGNFDEFDQMTLDDNLEVIVDKQINGKPFNLSDEVHMELLIKRCTKVGAEIIIVDTLAQAFNLVNENDNSEMQSKVVVPIQRLAQTTGAVVLLVHHIGKTTESGSHDVKIYRGRGASSLAGAVRCIFDLDHMKDGDKKVVTGHVLLSNPKVKGEPFADTILRLNTANRWFDVADQSAVSGQEENRTDSILRLINVPMSRSEIIAACDNEGVSSEKRTIDRILQFGVKSGLLEKVSGRGMYAPTDIWRDRYEDKVSASIIEFPIERGEASAA